MNANGLPVTVIEAPVRMVYCMQCACWRPHKQDVYTDHYVWNCLQCDWTRFVEINPKKASTASLSPGDVANDLIYQFENGDLRGILNHKFSFMGLLRLLEMDTGPKERLLGKRIITALLVRKGIEKVETRIIAGYRRAYYAFVPGGARVKQ